MEGKVNFKLDFGWLLVKVEFTSKVSPLECKQKSFACLKKYISICGQSKNKSCHIQLYEWDYYWNVDGDMMCPILKIK